MTRIVRTRDTCGGRPRIESGCPPLTSTFVRQFGMIRRRNRLHVFRIDAFSILALVMDMKSGRDFPKPFHESNSVGPDLFAMPYSLCVSVVRYCAVPIPAPSDWINHVSMFVRASLMAAYESIGNSTNNATFGIGPFWYRCFSTTSALAKSTASSIDDVAWRFLGRRRNLLRFALVVPANIIGAMTLDCPARLVRSGVGIRLLSAATFTETIWVGLRHLTRRDVNQITGTTSNRGSFDPFSTLNTSVGCKLSLLHLDLLIRPGCCRDRGRTSAARSFVCEGIIP
jgi:hypothetical protein